MAWSAWLSDCADLESEVLDVRGAGPMGYLFLSFFEIVFYSHKPNCIFLNPSTAQTLSPTLQPVSEYGYKPKPAQLRGEGWEVSEGRGGEMTGT